jgi:hypothetical protein
MENENFDVQKAMAELIEYVHHLADEIAEIKTSIMDDLINPIKDEYGKMQYDNALSDFRCKYAEKLEPFGDKLKAIEGDDFDIVKKTFDDFIEDNKGYEEAEYVEELAESIQSQLDAIGKAFGVEPEKIEEVKIETEDGEVKAEVEDGEVTAVENETEDTETKTETEVETPSTETEVPAQEVSEKETKVEETPAPDEESDEDNYKKWEDIYNKEVRK